MKALLDKDGLDRNPHNMKNGWYYENKGGLEVYVRHSQMEGAVMARGIIPWRSIKASLKRKDISDLLKKNKSHLQWDDDPLNKKRKK